MKRKIAALLMGLILLAGALAGCASKGAAYDKGADTMEIANGNVKTDSADGEAAAYAPGFGYESPREADPGVSPAGGMQYGKDVKLIFRADLTLQTLDFEKAEKDLNELVLRYKAYFESVESGSGSYYYDGRHVSAYYVIRVPAENYEQLLRAVGENCHVVSIRKSTEDVGIYYSDTERRLETAKTKYDRLLELLKKATAMEDIIKLEEALFQCQYEIDSFSTEINRYDDLINYSTVQINLQQVEKLEDGVDEGDKGFFTRLGESFRDGLEGFGLVLGDWAIFTAYNIVPIAIIIILAIAAFRLCRKYLLGRLRPPKIKSSTQDKEE